MNILRVVVTTNSWGSFMKHITECGNLEYGKDWNILKHNGFLNISISNLKEDTLVSIESPIVSSLDTEACNLVASTMYVSKVPITYIAKLLGISRQTIYNYLKGG